MKKPSLAVYISLPGVTGEAMQHWKDILGGELNIQHYGDVPMEGMPFTPPADAVAHAVLETPGGLIAGGDSMDDEDYVVKDTIYSLLYTVESPEEGEQIIKGFVEGGGYVGMPFERAPWGSWYGQVFDRYGIMWAISTD